MTNKFSSEAEKVLSQNQWSTADVTHLMSQFRQIIENENIKEEYKYLNLFCNWTLHPKISGSNTAFRILDLINTSLINSNIDPQNSKWINDAIIEGLSLHKLNEDIINLCIQFDINSGQQFNDLQKWRELGYILVGILEDKPIIFPDNLRGTVLNLYNQIEANTINAHGNDDMMPIGIKFTTHEQVPNQFLWQLLTKDSVNRNITIVGPIAFINQEMIDKYKHPNA